LAMAEAAKKTPQKLNEKKGSTSASSLEIVNSRQSKDIYLGLCGYVGCGMRTINKIIEEISKEWGYNVVHIRISALMENPLYFEPAALKVSESTQVNRHLKLQDIANKLRKHYKKNELLAEAAIAAIAAEKNNIDYNNDEYKGTVFIIDQFKRPEEIELFRVIYQHNFYLLGVLRDLDYRIPNLIDDESTKNDLHL
ncbi:TPA: cytidine deaminase, partial [Escherichia coli]